MINRCKSLIISLMGGVILRSRLLCMHHPRQGVSAPSWIFLSPSLRAKRGNPRTAALRHCERSEAIQITICGLLRRTSSQ